MMKRRIQQPFIPETITAVSFVIVIISPMWTKTTRAVLGQLESLDQQLHTFKHKKYALSITSRLISRFYLPVTGR